SDNNIKRADGSDASIARAEARDPFAGHPAIAAANDRMRMVEALPPPAAPLVPTGPDIHFGYKDSETSNQAKAAGCTAARSDKTWTLSCSGRSSYDFGSITIGGDLSLKFNPGAPAST